MMRIKTTHREQQVKKLGINEHREEKMLQQMTIAIRKMRVQKIAKIQRVKKIQ
jgi:hypothetical protein